MCLIVFSWQPETEQPLVLLANRDEVLERPAYPLSWWPEYNILAGRDLQALGTWLGVNSFGSFAALTNIRNPYLAEGDSSRGQLLVDYLDTNTDPATFVKSIARLKDHYSGFNILCGNLHELWFYHSEDDEPYPLPAGVYGLCNASLDTPWPKLVRLRQQFSQLLFAQADSHAFMALMQDPTQAEDQFLPKTGVPLAVERVLSSIFIQEESYGTRCSSLLRLNKTKPSSFFEQTYGNNGLITSQVQIDFSVK